MRKQQNYGNQSFVVSIRSQENHSWQGTLTWVEEQKQENFRSVLELLRLMDSALSSGQTSTIGGDEG